MVKEPNLRWCPFKPPPVFHLGDDGGGHVSSHVVKVAIHTLGCCSLQALTTNVMSLFLLLQERTNMLPGINLVLFLCTPKTFIKELFPLKKKWGPEEEWKWAGWPEDKTK